MVEKEPDFSDNPVVEGLYDFSTGIGEVGHTIQSGIQGMAEGVGEIGRAVHSGAEGVAAGVGGFVEDGIEAAKDFGKDVNGFFRDLGEAGAKGFSDGMSGEKHPIQDGVDGFNENMQNAARERERQMTEDDISPEIRKRIDDAARERAEVGMPKTVDTPGLTMGGMRQEKSADMEMGA